MIIGSAQVVAVGGPDPLASLAALLLVAPFRRRDVDGQDLNLIELSGPDPLAIARGTVVCGA
ncbi:MAG: hypothetical protein ACR2L2_18575 [Acidobacteriota bacterium]